MSEIFSLEANKDRIFWEEIESIEYLDSTEEYVYDFSVECVESFTTSEGIIVHNTLNTFHQCGISSKSSVNQGVPRITELVSVSKKIKTPSLTIYLTDEYNSMEKAKELVPEIQAIHLDFFIDNTSIHYDPDPLNTNIEEDREFIRDYYDFCDDEIDISKLSPWVLRVEFDPLYLINKNMKMFDFVSIIIKRIIQPVILHTWYSKNSINTFFY